MATDQAKGSIDERLANYHAPQQAEEVKPPEATPASEQKPAEVAKELPKEEVKPNLEEVEEQEALANSKNPKRTKEYIDKLKSKLKEATAPKEEPKGESAFDIFHPERNVNTEPEQPVQPQTPFIPSQRVATPYLNPLQVQNITNQFIDQNGNVDINGLNGALQRANYDAYQARLETQSLRKQIERIEETQQVKEAHANHPEIDPQNRDKFDKNLFNLVTDRLLKNMFQGKKESLNQVTKEIKDEIRYQAPVSTQALKDEGVKEYQARERARQQGPFEEGHGEERLDQETLTELRKQSRGRGPTADAAIGKRLKALGI